MFGQSPMVNRVEFNALRHSTYSSVTYTRLFEPFQSDNWQWGLGIGYGNGLGENGGVNAGSTIPVFGLLEYGSKHQFGLSLAYVYNFRLYKVPNLGTIGESDNLTIFTDYHSVNTALYYRYNFGLSDQYSFGIGAEYFIPMGETLGQKMHFDAQIRPFLSIGCRF